MEGRCERHPFDRAIDLCGRCGCEFCSDCIVYSFGPKKPPFCLPCAVEAAGVRQGAGFRPAPKRREQKELARRRAAFLKQLAATAPPEPDDTSFFGDAPLPTDETPLFGAVPPDAPFFGGEAPAEAPFFGGVEAAS